MWNFKDVPKMTVYAGEIKDIELAEIDAEEFGFVSIIPCCAIPQFVGWQGYITPNPKDESKGLVMLRLTNPSRSHDVDVQAGNWGYFIEAVDTTTEEEKKEKEEEKKEKPKEPAKKPI